MAGRSLCGEADGKASFGQAVCRVSGMP